MEALKYKRSAIKSKLTRFTNYLLKYEEQSSVNDLKLRRSKMENLLEEYEEIRMNLEVNHGETDEEDVGAFEESYYDVMGKADALIEKHTQKVMPCSQPAIETDVGSRTQVKLPPINIPTFDGSYDKWSSFYDLFQAVIDKHPSLDSIQKLHYLKLALKGEAIEIIQEMETSEENYPVAIGLLKDRFEDKRSTTLNHIKALFELPQVPKENYSNMRQYLDTFQRHVRSLKALKHTDEILLELFLLVLLSSKLDKTSLREWEVKVCAKKELSTYAEFCEFVQQKCSFLNSLQRNISQHSQSQHTYKNSYFSKPNSGYNTQKSQQLAYVATQMSQNGCSICKQKHKFYACQKFLGLSTQDRLKEAKRLNLCLNCLMADHAVTQCKSGPCKKCSRKHNTLLHLETVDSHSHTTQFNAEQPSSSNSDSTAHISNVHTSCLLNNTYSHILLATAVVHVFNNKGERFTCRVLLDSGSQSHFITSEMCRALGLEPKQEEIHIKGISNSPTRVTESVELTVHSRFNNYHTNLKFLVIAKITDNLPVVGMNISQLPIPQNLNLADPEFNISHKIDMLIGAEVYLNLLCIGQIQLNKFGPTMQKTLLGWVIAGKVHNNNTNSQMSNVAVCNLSIDEKLSNQIKSFWELENVCPKSVMSKEEHECENHFQNTFSRKTDGRFCVKLPFKENKHLLTYSKDTALKRFHALERRFHKDAQLKNQYTIFMNEYLTLNHMQEVLEDDNLGYYLPHHAVCKKESLTTKLRVVFDASARTASGVSLNDTLMKGPIIQKELFEIIISFRFHNVAITADIQKMYRQVLVHENDIKYQKILWRDNPGGKVKTYTLSTVTYGTTSAPYLAVRCLKQLAVENMANCPHASEAIMNNFYVDDLLTGAQTEEEAVRLHKEITQILNDGGFELHKFPECLVTLRV